MQESESLALSCKTGHRNTRVHWTLWN